MIKRSDPEEGACETWIKVDCLGRRRVVAASSRDGAAVKKEKRGWQPVQEKFFLTPFP